MKKYIIILFAFISSFVNAQEYDFQQLCLDCAAANGYYCGDDPANWTQYSPNGCVPNNWLNDGWEDCVDATDENGAEPTTPGDCAPPPPPPCDTVYIDIPVIDTLGVPFYIYETIIQLDTIVETEYITQIVIDSVFIETFVPEFIYVTDTVTIYEDVLDTLYIDVIEEVEVVVFDTIIETEYVEFFTIDTVIEYVDVIITEYIDCDTGLPCTSNIPELLNKSSENSVIYNINGQAIREPNGLYIQNGKVKFKIK
tara:strand:- start:4664 stop:5425 length:762 start_codon:yes stop_codon:yes gene_type:complete